MMLDTTESINAFRLLALKGALKLECIGMKRRGQSASVMIREILRGAGLSAPSNRQDLLTIYEAYLRAKKILID